jgi:hypothetical protein
MQNAIHEVPGADALFQWLGYWPDFHDAEVLGIDLNRSGSARVPFHTFETSNQVGEDRCYASLKHVIISFLLERLTTIQFQGFNQQNVVSEVALVRTKQGFQLFQEPCHGVSVRQAAEHNSIEIEPVVPLDSQYRKNGS